ncbi:MAG: capsular biosynthesis protein CpsI [Hyphomonas sp.]|uniref:NAD-dependent epimerase n=1 Tax=Hyphomonas sp. TaxID=87 RepID=UPI0025B9CAD4|nr:NAD-dependent epimerase [Hyphomonas sp.]MBA4338919.1 capsular biosynthesis protein CpsI [Hyphomonas sp.]
MSPVLVTGAAGFIGYHLSEKLLSLGHTVVGLDNLNTYYDVNLKKARLERLLARPGFQFARQDLTDSPSVRQLFEQHRFELVFNLAAQAGVRHSLTHPEEYISSNIVGFLSILEASRHCGVSHLVYASSSSVYGAVTRMPFSIHQNVDHPLSVYAASKKANELMAHSYSHLYRLPTTGVRFFTAYGPWGRPDMAMFIFAKAILNEQPIQLFNHGNMLRDFTFIDDIVEGLVRLGNKPATPNLAWSGDAPDPGTSAAPYRIYNIGNNSPVRLTRLIEVMEEALGKKAIKEFLPIQPGDVPEAFANVDDLIADVAFSPKTSIEYGVNAFLTWYREYNGV